MNKMQLNSRQLCPVLSKLVNPETTNRAKRRSNEYIGNAGIERKGQGRGPTFPQSAAFA